MGGWTRIWVVLSVLGAVISAWWNFGLYQNTAGSLNSLYQQDIQSAHDRDNCARQSLKKPWDMTPGELQNDCTIGLLKPLPGPLGPYLQHLSDEHSHDLWYARWHFIKFGGTFAIANCALFGILFFTIGWIRKGFSQRKG
jgi:hypothetical protein